MAREDYATRIEVIADALLDPDGGRDAVLKELAKPMPVHDLVRYEPQPKSDARDLTGWRPDPKLSYYTKARILRRDRYQCRFCGWRVGPSPVHWRLYEALDDLLPWHPNLTDAEHWHPLARGFTAEFEHLFPKRRGGCRSDPRNVVSACYDCARGTVGELRAKGTLTPAEVGMRVLPIGPEDDWVGLTDRLTKLAELPCVAEKPPAASSHRAWKNAMARAACDPFDLACPDAEPEGFTLKEAFEQPLGSSFG